MFCSKCGKEIEKDMKFCIHCGNKVSFPSSTENCESKVKISSSTKKSNSRVKKIVKISLIIILAIILLSVMITIINKSNSTLKKATNNAKENMNSNSSIKNTQQTKENKEYYDFINTEKKAFNVDEGVFLSRYATFIGGNYIFEILDTTKKFENGKIIFSFRDYIDHYRGRFTFTLDANHSEDKIRRINVKYSAYEKMSESEFFALQKNTLLYIVCALMNYNDTEVRTIFENKDGEEYKKIMGVYNKVLENSEVSYKGLHSIISHGTSMPDYHDYYDNFSITLDVDNSTENLQQVLADNEDNYVGIGIYMLENTTYNKVEIISVIKDSPAEKAGIKSGDLILKVNGIEYTADDKENISNKIKGEEGTTVTMEILRDTSILNFEITREKIDLSVLE